MNIQYVDYPKPGPMTPRSGGVITDLIIHHSAGSISQTPREIDEEHRARGMAMIGYNWVIDGGGVVYSGRPISFVPAAAFGRNTESVNVCLLGNFQEGDSGYTGPPTESQLTALSNLAVYVHGLLPHIVRTIGHRDVAPMFYPNNQWDYSTACPGNKLYEKLPAIRDYVRSELHSKV